MPNTAPARHTKMPRKRMVQPVMPKKLTEVRSGRTSSASLAKAGAAPDNITRIVAMIMASLSVLRSTNENMHFS
jgi:hypothetical protein